MFWEKAGIKPEEKTGKNKKKAASPLFSSIELRRWRSLFFSRKRPQLLIAVDWREIKNEGFLLYSVFSEWEPDEDIASLGLPKAA